MGRVLVPLLLIGIVVYTVIDCVRSTDEERLGVHPALWILGMVLLPPFGSAAWIAVRIAKRGERRSRPASYGPGPARPYAPDDDPEFLWRLEQIRRQRARESEERLLEAAAEDLDDLEPEDFALDPDEAGRDGDDRALDDADESADDGEPGTSRS